MSVPWRLLLTTYSVLYGFQFLCDSHSDGFRKQHTMAFRELLFLGHENHENEELARYIIVQYQPTINNNNHNKTKVITIHANDKWMLIQQMTPFVSFCHLFGTPFLSQNAQDSAKPEGPVYGFLSGTLCNYNLSITSTAVILIMTCKIIPKNTFIFRNLVGGWTIHLETMLVKLDHFPRGHKTKMFETNTNRNTSQGFQPQEWLRTLTDGLNDLEAVWKAPGNKTIHWKKNLQISQNATNVVSREMYDKHVGWQVCE